MDALQGMAQKIALLERRLAARESADNNGTWVFVPPLASSWQNYGLGYITARLNLNSRFIFADGAVKSGTIGSTFSVMGIPGGYIPSEYSLAASTCATGIARIDAYYGGIISVSSGSTTFTSIGGLRFPLGAAWDNLTLQGTWARFTYGAAPAWCLDRYNIMQLRGVVSSGSSGSVIATAPIFTDGINAAKIYATMANGAFARVDLLTNGNIQHISGSTATLFLNNITTPLRATWTAPALLNSWANYGLVSGVTYANAGYWKDASGMVHLDGVIKTGSSGTVAFILPEGYRPSATVTRLVAANNVAGGIDIFSNGEVKIVSGSSVYTSLCGVKFMAEL